MNGVIEFVRPVVQVEGIQELPMRKKSRKKKTSEEDQEEGGCVNIYSSFCSRLTLLPLPITVFRVPSITS